MKKLLHIVLFVGLLGFVAPETASSQDRSPEVVSPEVHEDETVTFRYLAPRAEKVVLHGEFMQEPKAMKRGEQGVWSITVGPIEPDLYPYFFKVDGIEVADPNNVDLFPNERFKRSLVDIPGDQPQLHHMQDVPHGAIGYRYYKSNSLDLIRPLLVYTPPGYENSSTNYPVLYLIHGMTDTEETWLKVGRINRIMDNLIAQDLIEPMLVVMPYANPYPALQKKKPEVEADLLSTDIFITEMLDEVIPFTEANYRVAANADSRAIAGFSLGGRQTLAAGLANPDVFSWVAAYAPAIWEREFEENFSNLYASPERLNNELSLFWLSCGRSDFLFNSADAFTELLEEKDVRHQTYFTEGGHTWMNVRDYVAETAQLLFK